MKKAYTAPAMDIVRLNTALIMTASETETTRSTELEDPWQDPWDW